MDKSCDFPWIYNVSNDNTGYLRYCSHEYSSSPLSTTVIPHKFSIYNCDPSLWSFTSSLSTLVLLHTPGMSGGPLDPDAPSQDHMATLTQRAAQVSQWGWPTLQPTCFHWPWCTQSRRFSHNQVYSHIIKTIHTQSRPYTHSTLHG
jgi:hypothetical protein